MADIWTTVKKMAQKDLERAKPESKPPEDVTLLAAKIKEVVALLTHVEEHNGYRGVADAAEVPEHQVREIDAARLKRLAELTKDIAEGEAIK